MPSPTASERASIQISDLYLFDPIRKTFAVRYPLRIPVLLAITGIGAFLATGFLGYPTDTTSLYTVFHPAWLLFLWFSAMIVIMQWSIFRHNESRRWRWETLSVTFVCIVAVATAYARPDILRDVVTHIAVPLNALGISVEQGRLIWNLANFGIIAVYVLDRAILWVRGERIRHVNFFMELDAFGVRTSQPSDSTPTTWELISQDLFAGAALCVFLGTVLQTAVLNVLTQQIASAHTDMCAISWVTGPCRIGGAHNPPTLTFIDLSLASFAVAASVLILGIVLLSVIFLQPTGEETPTVVQAVRAILLAALNPLDVFVRNLRNVLWPGLILIGTIGAATSARYIRLYLHVLSDKQTCSGSSNCPDLKEFGLYSLNAQQFQAQALHLEVLFLTLAVAGGVFGTLAITASARVLLLEWRIRGKLATNWVRFLASIAHKLLLVFWVFSLGLSALMVAMQHVNLTGRTPFPQLGVSTALSLVYFAVNIPLFILRRKTTSRGRSLAPVTPHHAESTET
ncbi:MAG: hypothetical protein ACHQ4H_04570 [Ktedonobacterales bacterium]